MSVSPVGDASVQLSSLVVKGWTRLICNGIKKINPGPVRLADITWTETHTDSQWDNIGNPRFYVWGPGLLWVGLQWHNKCKKLQHPTKWNSTFVARKASVGWGSWRLRSQLGRVRERCSQSSITCCWCDLHLDPSGVFRVALWAVHICGYTWMKKTN